MKLSKAETRDKKHFKRQHGMRVSGKSVFVTQAVLIKKAGR